MKPTPLRDWLKVLARFLVVAVAIPATAWVVAAQEYSPDANTVLLWHLNETDPALLGCGFQVIDSSGNGLDGCGGWTAIVPGKFGNARSFGSGPNLFILANPVLDFGADPFTIELWVKTTQDFSSVEQRLVYRPSDGAYSLLIGVGGVPMFRVFGTMAAGEAIGTTAVNDGNWHHVAGVRDSSNLLIYVDGELEGSADASLLGPLATVSFSQVQIPFPDFNGALDEVRISNTARVAAEFNVALEVQIDIKPGSEPNSINLSSAGVVPVAILSSATFDATTVNPESVSLAGARVRMVGKSAHYLCSAQDSNGDGILDLVCQVLTAQFMIEPGDSVAVLEAETNGGTLIRGQDSIQIVRD
jgi:hypothetical protein